MTVSQILSWLIGATLAIGAGTLIWTVLTEWLARRDAVGSGETHPDERQPPDA